MLSRRKVWLHRLYWFLGIAAILVSALGGAWFWLDSLFEEPEAMQVASLPLHLGDKTVLGVFAHPDDELFVAGLLHDAAKNGCRVDTVTLTRGEKGYFQPYICREEDLGTVRSAESLKYGFVLGINGQEIWDYPDGGVSQNAWIREQILRRLVALIREKKPDLIVTFDPTSGYSMHEDHIGAGELASQAATQAADPHYALGSTSVHHVRHLAYIEAPRQMMRLLGGEVGEKVADLQFAPNYSIAVASSIKENGWRIHESQKAFFRKSYGVPAWLLYALQDKEHYSVKIPRSGTDGTVIWE